MKTELLALIDDLVKSELYVTEGKFSAAKDAKRIRADIVFLLDKAEQAQAPAAQAPAAVEPVSGVFWRERWFGSGGKEGYEGWSIVGDRELIAYLGREISSEAVRAIVMAHNTTSAAPTTKAERAPYDDSTLHLSVGESSFEDWYQNYLPNSIGHKQIARDAYSAGMGDPLVIAKAAAPADALTDQQIRAWWMADNALEDADMCKLDDFTKVVRAVEAKFAGRNQDAVAQPTRQALRDLVDATWSKCTASSEVPATPLADLLIDGVFPGTEAPIALTLAGLLEIRRAAEDFESHGETDVDGELLIRGAQAGYLECTHFQMLDESALDRDIQAAQAIQKPDPT